MATLRHSHSQISIKENPKNREIIGKKDLNPNIKTPSPSNLFINYSFKENDKLSRNNNKKLTSISLNENKTKYANRYIFSKREFAFHQSIQNNKKVFKYQNYSLFEEKAGTTINRIKKRIKNNNNLKRNKYSSLYLTQNMLRANKTMLPLINNEKSIYKDFYENNFNDNIDYKKNIKEKMINTNYAQVMKDRSFLSKIVD